MIEYLVLLLAIPLGYILAGLTNDEENIYMKKQYFPTIIIGFVVLAVMSHFFSQEIFFTSTFVVVMMVSWMKFSY